MAIDIELPASMPINLAIFAIGLVFLTIFISLGPSRQTIPLGRNKFIILLATQVFFVISLLGMMFSYRSIYSNESPGSIISILIANITVAFIFLVILYLILTYNHTLYSLAYISPHLLIGVYLPAALTQTAFIVFFSIYRVALPLAGIIFMALVFSYQLYRCRKHLVSPFDRRSIVDSMKLGWMIVDADQVILDINDAAEVIIGQPREKLVGKTGKTLISKWTTLFPDSHFSEKELQASLEHEKGVFSYYQVYSLPLLRDSEFLGRILIWTDVTERKKSEDIRKRTLNATLGLLQSISVAASHSTDINSFLETAIYQIVNSFNGTIGFIFMRDVEFIGEEKVPLELVSTYNVKDLPGAEKIAEPLTVSIPLLDGVLHISSDELFSRADLLNLGDDMEDALLCPIIIQSQIQGGIVILRSDKIPFRADEIVRLEMLANELSTLIHVEMQRHGYAAMIERKKIVRILHDTVTQQLYGLLYFIDLAQAQLDFGTISTVSSTLDRLGETGRQALKEMRMFLYSLQPVNVAKVGFVDAIRQRLDAVEGRANVKTKFVIMQNVTLSPKQEICLYEIGLEALNNILRHASAKNVSLTLKQFPKNIQFEIVDDGRGFDVKARKAAGGLGLQNMKESAKRIHARIIIHSTPGAGSSIKVVVPRGARLPVVEK